MITDPEAAPREPLAALAQFAIDHAPELCAPEHECCSYHRGWSMVRLLSKRGELPAGQDFFAKGLAKAAVGGRARVLLSGAADTGLAALVLAALAQNGIGPDLVLVDRCATAIAQNRLFARHAGFEIELHHGDVAALDCAPVDAVVAHSFLNFLHPDNRAAVAATWARVLRPGGLLLIHQRLGPARAGKNPALVALECERLEAAALAFGYSATAAREIGDTGRDFWTQRPPRVPTSEPILRAMLEGAGLEIVSLTYRDHAATSSPSHVEGLTLETPQASIVARRPPG